MISRDDHWLHMSKYLPSSPHHICRLEKDWERVTVCYRRPWKTDYDTPHRQMIIWCVFIHTPPMKIIKFTSKGGAWCHVAVGNASLNWLCTRYTMTWNRNRHLHRCLHIKNRERIASMGNASTKYLSLRKRNLIGEIKLREIEMLVWFYVCVYVCISIFIINIYFRNNEEHIIHYMELTKQIT